VKRDSRYPILDPKAGEVKGGKFLAYLWMLTGLTVRSRTTEFFI